MLTGDVACTALRDVYRGVTGLVESLQPFDFLKPTRCAGWAVEDVLFHLLRDTPRAFTAVTNAPPDVDFVSYWRPFSADDPEALVHARAIRIAAASFPSPASPVATWIETSEATLRSMASFPASAGVETQGHVLRLPDFAATLAVEAAIHHLDMTVSIPEADPPGSATPALVRRTLDGFLGSAAPTAWSDAEYALKGTGRVPLDADDIASLGLLVGRFPLFS